jgi:hypothetical protein
MMIVLFALAQDNQISWGWFVAGVLLVCILFLVYAFYAVVSEKKKN